MVSFCPENISSVSHSYDSAQICQISSTLNRVKVICVIVLFWCPANCLNTINTSTNLVQFAFFLPKYAKLVEGQSGCKEVSILRMIWSNRYSCQHVCPGISNRSPQSTSSLYDFYFRIMIFPLFANKFSG